MTDIATQIAAQPADEHITITVFGRLALLRSQVDAGLDEETADRQYLLEQVNNELAWILHDLATVAGGGVVTSAARPALRVVASYSAPWANAAVRVATRVDQAPDQAATTGPAATVTVAWLDASGPRADTTFLLREAADLATRLAVGLDECSAAQGTRHHHASEEVAQ